jgi:hypothetical protein
MVRVLIITVMVTQGKIQSLETGQRYKAIIALTEAEAFFASNGLIENKLRAAGFKEVVVTGSKTQRVASGVWNQTTKNLDGLPSDVIKKISNIQKIES